jgi:hypothetical protein
LASALIEIQSPQARPGTPASPLESGSHGRLRGHGVCVSSYD